MPDPVPQEWLREAEIKHCRVTMLAFVGFIFTDFYHLPGFDYTTLEAHDACVASGAMSQLLLWIGLLEVISFVGIDQMLRGSGREPGDYGFDPLGLSRGKSEAWLDDMKLRELNNGRVAMVAISGMVAQELVNGLNLIPADEVLEMGKEVALVAMESQCTGSANEAACAKAFEAAERAAVFAASQ